MITLPLHNSLNVRQILFDLSRDGEERLTLPSTFNAFLDTSKEHTWRTTFTDPWVFLAAWKDDDEMDLFVDSSPPLCNIFYLLQALAPGMLVIRRDAIVDLWKRAVSRAVPQKSWIEEHYHSLEEVMGSTKAMNALLSAAEDQNAMAYDDELENARSDEESDTDDREYDYHGYLSWDQDDESSYVNMWGFREPYDLTACSSECGYCGRCDY